MHRIVPTFVALLLCPCANAWLQSSPATFSRSATTARPRFSNSALGMVESFNLEATQISGNHEEVGQELADSLQKMLDEEWMPQEVHVRMANDAKESYVSCRQAGEADVMAIMTTVADKLTDNWHNYHADAFVNAWDCANYVSDWLTTKSGGEGCECTQKIY